MNKDDAISIILDSQYDEKNLKKLFSQWLSDDMYFYDGIPHGSLDLYINNLDKIYNISLRDEAENRYIKIMHEGTFFHLWLHKTNQNLIELYISSFTYIWHNLFNQTCSADIARYFRFLFKICNNFPIKKLKLDYEWQSVKCETINTIKAAVTANFKLNNIPHEDDASKLNINAITYQIKLSDKITGKTIESTEIKQKLQTNPQITFIASKNNLKADVTLFAPHESEYNVIVQPIKPYVVKKNDDNKIEKIDLAQYIELFLELCENFAIDEFYAQSNLE